MFSSLNIFLQHRKKRKGAFLWWGYEFLFLRVMNAKVELRHSYKVWDKDVGCRFADVFPLGIQATQAQAVVCSWFSMVPGAGVLL